MTYTAKCPVCSTNIEYGEDWIGRHYKCNCGVTVSLTKPEEKKLDVPILTPPPAPPKQTNSGPSMAVAWGWTWRVFLSVAILSFLIWFVTLMGISLGLGWLLNR